MSTCMRVHACARVCACTRAHTHTLRGKEGGVREKEREVEGRETERGRQGREDCLACFYFQFHIRKHAYPNHSKKIHFLSSHRLPWRQISQRNMLIGSWGAITRHVTWSFVWVFREPAFSLDGLIWTLNHNAGQRNELFLFWIILWHYIVNWNVKCNLFLFYTIKNN